MLDQLKRRYQQHRAISLDARASIELSRLGLGYIPWTTSALRPAAMAQLINEVLINDRRTVVELGAGISTLYFAKVLGQIGGRLISIENSPQWAGIVQSMLVGQGVGGNVTMVVAPLGPCSSALHGLDWYDGATLAGALVDVAIDLLLLDGPEAFESGAELACFPAYPVLRDGLSPRCAIALDDASRPGERDILARWTASPGYDFKVENGHAGIALLRRGHFFNTAI